MTLDEAVVELTTKTGPMRVHAYRRAGGGRRPGVVLYSEIYQQTGPIKRAALRLAGRGYLVAVPEIFHAELAPGTVLAYDKSGTDEGNRLKYDTPLSTFDDDAHTVLAWLASEGTGRVGAIGFCIGGHLAFRAALDPLTLGAACFYATDIHTDSLGRGRTSDSLRRVRDVRGELMMVWGRQDPHIPEEGRTAIRAALVEAGVKFSWHELNAVHAFMRDEGPRYDPALADIGYALALEMFARVLG